MTRTLLLYISVCHNNNIIIIVWNIFIATFEFLHSRNSVSGIVFILQLFENDNSVDWALFVSINIASVRCKLAATWKHQTYYVCVCVNVVFAVYNFLNEFIVRVKFPQCNSVICLITMFVSKYVKIVNHKMGSTQ